MTSTLAGLNLWSLWSGSTDRRTSRLFAAANPGRLLGSVPGGAAGPRHRGG